MAYLSHMKTLSRKAMKTTFDADYPSADFRNLPVELNYPVKESEVPGIWVDFEPIGPLRPVGIDHAEDVEADSGGGIYRTTRWSFAGNITYTCVAMSSLERDRIFDEMVATVAFGRYDDQRAEFRRTFETDPLIQVNINYDEIDQRGFSAAPGTPWNTAAMMYEGTISIQCQGEFVNEPGTTLLLPISEIRVFPYAPPIEQDPFEGDNTPPWLD